MAAKKKRPKAVVEEVVEEPQAEEVAAEETTEAETPAAENPAAETEAAAPAAEPAPAAPVETPAPTPTVVEPAPLEVGDTGSSEDSSSSTPEEPQKEKKKLNIKMIIIITIISALVAAFVSGGVYVYLNGRDAATQNTTETEEDSTEDTTDEETAEETTEEESTDDEETTEETDLTSYTIRVLNGSGQIGAAGDASDVIEGAGFEVTDTGNADNYEFTDTIVQAKDSVDSSALDTLVDALSGEYSVDTGDTLEDSEDYDIIVTVGSE